MFHRILATGDKSTTVQQRASASNNPPDTDLNNTTVADTTEDIQEDTVVNNDEANSGKTADNGPFTRKSLSAHGEKPPPKRAKVTGGHVLAESIVAVIEEMRANRKNRQEAIEACGEIEAETAEKLYQSQVKLAQTPTDKAVNELLNRYAEDDKLLVKDLEVMRNAQNVLIFISLSKVPAIQKR